MLGAMVFLLAVLGGVFLQVMGGIFLYATGSLEGEKRISNETIRTGIMVSTAFIALGTLTVMLAAVFASRP